MFLGKGTFSGEKIVHPDGTLSLEETHDVGNGVLGWNLEKHVHVIGTSIAFQYFYFFLLGEFSDDLSNLDSGWSEENFLAIFWYNDNVECAIPYYVAL